MSAAWSGRPSWSSSCKLIEAGQPYDKAAYEACLKDSIEEVVRQQVEAGVDIVSDGEFSKGRNWAFYVHDRISGIATRRHARRDEGPAVVGRRRPGHAGVSGVLRRIRPRLRARHAARQALRRQRPAQIQRRHGEARHRHAEGGGRQGRRQRRRSCRWWRRRARCPAPRTSIMPTRRACCSRSPTACTRNTRRSSMPASTCRSTTPSCPTCTSGWCRR